MPVLHRSLLGVLFLGWLGQLGAAEPAAPKPRVITIATANSALVLYVGSDDRLNQLSYGRARTNPEVPRTAGREDEFYPQSGDGYVLEPALQAFHADGNVSTQLIYVGHETTQSDRGVVQTRITLKDRHYPFWATLCFRAYPNEDVIEQWTEIRHEENQPVRLARFASSAPAIKASRYWLSHFHGDVMREAELMEERLTVGTKIIDSKMGIRAHRRRNPFFILSVDGPAQEEQGEVYGGTLAWSGTFQFAFDVDWNNRLRVLAGINPFAAEYRLAPGKIFTTPAMIWTWSDAGKGRVSRNFHRWARNHWVRDGFKPRPVLLNNWEATYFDFDEKKIVSLLDGAKALGIELFLLDDGWFGNKHPRNDDFRGLGDWQVNTKKLPQGLSYLAAEANKRGVGFGIWIEPEMVNPGSELYEQHPNWIIRQPNRDLPLPHFRNQVALDLTRPEVKQFVTKVIDDTLGANPGIGYVKWDCNGYIIQPGSSYLPPEEQQHLMTDYQWSLYETMRGMAEKYPNVMAMACSGGSGRADYGVLRYFHSFWPSDNTDPAQRVFIQWGFGHVFPASTLSNHVTQMGKRPPKFAVDVALGGAFGVDRDVSKMSPEEHKAVTLGIKVYKESVRDLVLNGDLYRIESPYEQKRAVMSFVSLDRAKSVLFVYQLGEAAFGAVKPRGLDPAKRYLVREINLPEGAKSAFAVNGKVFNGATLMADGFGSPLKRAYESAVLEISEER